MEKRMRLRVAMMLLGLTNTMMLGAAIPAAAQDSGIEIGAKAPGVALETLDGKPANLAQYVGKTPVLIEFWATWCPNCRELEPTLKAVHTKYASQMKFVGVSV